MLPNHSRIRPGQTVEEAMNARFFYLWKGDNGAGTYQHTHAGMLVSVFSNAPDPQERTVPPETFDTPVRVGVTKDPYDGKHVLVVDFASVTAFLDSLFAPG